MQLNDHVQYLKGVGPARAKVLARLGIATIADLLGHYPREYDDRRYPAQIVRAVPGQRVVVRAAVLAADVLKTSPRMQVFKVILRDASGTAAAVFFRAVRPYARYDVFASLRKQLVPGAIGYFCGMVEAEFGVKTIHVDEYELLQPGAGEREPLLHFERIVPVYPLSAGMTQKWLRTLQFHAVTACAAAWPEAIPPAIRERCSLLPAAEAIRAIHFPLSPGAAEDARRRCAFEEFLLLELALAIARRTKKDVEKTIHYTVTKKLLSPFREQLGFEFTAAQKKVINEIFGDMERPQPMRRMLMGDVGSGKTVVAVSAMLLAVENGRQAALLAPTEILAEQHYLTLSRLLSGLPVRVALMTGQGSARARARETLRASIAEGAVDIVVGTHALIERGVTFKHLSLAVIDEQHRFGVLQRAAVQAKGDTPDVLLMTATPIPRTLAMTLYGDMDVSVIDRLPPGRTPIETLHLENDRAWERVKAEIARGHQAYIVYPLVEESDKVELKAAVTEAAVLSSTVFKGYRVGLLHGQMKLDEKDTAMKDFRAGAFDILIATTVIEVGIDVPNATVIVIEHADRFGLATLHQLRGRVGRGPAPSCCVLLGRPASENARRRMAVMLQTTDGFRIAEEDLSLRGPGEFFGTAQHGMPLLKAGDLVRDTAIIQDARAAARAIMEADPRLQSPEHNALRAAVTRAYAERLPLASVG